MVRLYYWPGIQGRGELVRLTLEDSGVSYVDVARLPEADGGGVPAILKILGDTSGIAHLAVPVLEADGVVLSHTANILAFLGRRVGLVPESEADRHRALQLQLTVQDLFTEVHDTHHPTASSLTYEEQRDAALPRAKAFREQRMPKYLGTFERALTARGGPYLFGEQATYVDLSLFQVVRGLEYAFPRAAARVLATTPALAALADVVAARPRIAAYLASERRVPFNEKGIFRRYPELDDPS